MTAEQKAELARCDREIAEAQAGIATDGGALIGAADWSLERNLIELEFLKMKGIRLVCPDCKGKKDFYALKCRKCKRLVCPKTSLKEYRAWVCMKGRCLGNSDKSAPLYKSRGITVCDKWAKSFEAFYADMGPKPSFRHQLDRINNDQGYYPGNCRWATPIENSRNKSVNVKITLNGQTKTLVEWSEKTGLRADTIRHRIKRAGWSIQDALSAPVGEGPKKVMPHKLSNESIKKIRETYKSGIITQKSIARSYGVSQSLICKLIHSSKQGSLFHAD
jgi:hypothetical protein